MSREECKIPMNNRECDKSRIGIASLGHWDPDRVLGEGLLKSLRNGSKIGSSEFGALLFANIDGVKRDNEKINERIVINSEDGNVLVNIDIGRGKHQEDKVLCIEVTGPRGTYSSTINGLVGAGILRKEGVTTL